MAINNIQDLNKAVEKALLILQNNDVIIHPTETIYGFAGNGLSSIAYNRINELKGRAPDNPYLNLFSSIEQAQDCGVIFSKKALLLAKKFWPGPLTMILKVNDDSKLVSLSKDRMAGCRISPHPFVEAMLNKTGFPLLSTSVNKTGAPPLLKASLIEKEFGNDASIFIEEKDYIDNTPSTIISITENKVSLVREGLIKWSKIEESL